MPLYNISLDDTSPLIVYEGIWSDSSHDDPQYVRYTDQTFHATQTANASAALFFNGTGVYLYGAKRANHGPYSVSIDGQVVSRSNGAGNEEYQQLLFGISTLSYGCHYVEITNTGAPSYMDLDFVNITIGDGKSETVSQDVPIDDTAFIFDPNWSLSTNNPSTTYYNSTYHRTTAPNALANIHFNGNAIQVFGTTSTDHGMFTLSLDGAPAITLNGTAPTFRPQTLLYRYDGLPSGDHVLTIENVSNATLELDRAIISTYTASASQPSTGLDPAAASNGALAVSSGSPMNTGAIVGITVGLVVIISMAATAAFILARQRKAKRRLYQDGARDLPWMIAQSNMATQENAVGFPPSYNDSRVGSHDQLISTAYLPPVQPIASRWPGDRKGR